MKMKRQKTEDKSAIKLTVLLYHPNIVNIQRP